ncbi:MAG: precorrin-6y C5,15-methyltransferase (decarboxylating) subunit CbiE [Pirellulaceae bacterium]|jgi:precorrin-6Y C5,15-methyltransferase (decarboxylating)|nr:precorrin-6y C5,15-methyltransferase (decarboxylating) subunit CbiE [Pirellulaceae bacterium]
MSVVPEKVHILGIGDDGLDGLTSAARGLLDAADVIVGSAHTLAAVGGSAGRRLVVDGDPEEVARVVAANASRRVVVLATGDPLFYGTARYLCERLGKDRFEVVPHVSSMQLAFARVKESWDEAYLTNLANQQLDRAMERIRTAERVGLFTTDEMTPGRVAQALLERGIDYFTGYVCENLGSPDERVTQGELGELAEHAFSPLNVMILVRKPHVPDRPRELAGRRLFGNPDELFLQSRPKRGLLTPAEVRSLALAELDLGPSSTVWDVGAGSGSVSIEAAQLAARGEVYAIEMDVEDYQLISANAERFSVRNLTPVLGRAPEAWRDLPDPDAVFIGGTGRQVRGMVEQAFARLRPGGRMVVSVVSVESVAEVEQLLRQLAGETNVWMLNVARGTLQFETLRFEAMAPTFLLAAVKPLS